MGWSYPCGTRNPLLRAAARTRCRTLIETKDVELTQTMDKTAKPQESGKRAAAAKPAEPKTDRKQTPKAQRGSNAGRSPARKPNRTEEKRASLQHQAIRLAKKGKSKAKSILKSVAVATRTQTKALQIRSIITSKGPQAEQQNKENIQQLAGGRGPVARKGGKPTLLDEIRYKIEKNKFLFEELVKRDFKKKYKRTSLGMLWSVLNPLLTLLVMSLVFTQFFGRTMPHYTIYLFSGNLLFSYYRESTTGGMSALVSNAGIFSKVNIPKYMFVLSRNVSSLLNFALTLLVYFFFVIMDGLPITPRFLYLLYPIVCMVVFNIGMELGMFPVVGLTLPLMSYGGSSMISSMLSVGLALNAGIHRGQV